MDGLRVTSSVQPLIRLQNLLIIKVILSKRMANIVSYGAQENQLQYYNK